MKKKTLNSNFLSISGYISQPEVMLNLCLHFQKFQHIYIYGIKVMLIKKWLFQVLQILSCCASNKVTILINQKCPSPNYSSVINLTIFLKTRKQYISPKFKILHPTILRWNPSKVELKALTFLSSARGMQFYRQQEFQFWIISRAKLQKQFLQNKNHNFSPEQ